MKTYFKKLILPGTYHSFDRYTDRGLAEFLEDIEQQFTDTLNATEANRCLVEANARCGREHEKTDDPLALSIRAGMLRRLYYVAL